MSNEAKRSIRFLIDRKLLGNRFGKDPPLEYGRPGVKRWYLKYDETMGSEWNRLALEIAIRYVKKKRPDLFAGTEERDEWILSKITEHVRWVHRKETRRRLGHWRKLPYRRGRAKYSRKYNVSTWTIAGF